MAFKLGTKAKCILTGYRGTVVQASQYIGGINQYKLQSGLDKDGKWVDPKWFPENQLAAVKGDKPAAEAVEKEEAPEAEEPEAEAAEGSEDDGGFGEAEETEAEEKPELSLDDIIEACQKHAKAAGGREKTQALLLKQFKCKNVKLLKPSQFAAVIAALKVEKKK